MNKKLRNAIFKYLDKVYADMSEHIDENGVKILHKNDKMLFKIGIGWITMNSTISDDIYSMFNIEWVISGEILRLWICEKYKIPDILYIFKSSTLTYITFNDHINGRGRYVDIDITPTTGMTINYNLTYV